MKTRFQYKSPVAQIYEWRREYVDEYGSMPTVIEMDSDSWMSVMKQLTGSTLYALDVSAEGERLILGMHVVIKEHNHDEG